MTKEKLFTTMFVVGVVCLFTCAATICIAQSSDVPHTISYQGIMTDVAGTTPITDGNHVATFTIYADASGTNRIWWSTISFTTSKGLFSVLLGDAGMLLPTPMNAPLWLGVALEGTPEMRPLTRLMAAPYALGIADNAVSTLKIQDLNVTGPKLQDSAVTLAKIRTGAVSTSKLQDNAVTAQKMGVDYLGHVTLNNAAVTTDKGKDIDIKVGTNLTMTSTKDSAGNVHVVIDGPSASGGAVPSDALIAFPDAGAHAGYTYTGYSFGLGEQWSAKALLPGTRTQFAAAAVNGKIFVFGGFNQSTPMGASALVYQYDPATNLWTAMTNMPTARYGMSAVALNGKIYIIGGVPSLTTVEEFDPVSGVGGSWRTMAPMGTGRGNGLSTVVLNGLVYAIGGYTPSGTAGIEAFDPNAGSLGTWTSKPNAPNLLGYSAAVVNGKIYSFSGGTDYLATQQYDPNAGPSGAWTVKTSSNVVQSSYSCCILNGRVYFFGGSLLDCVMEYDPASGTGGTWTQRGMMIRSGQNAYNTIVAIGSTAYVLGSFLSKFTDAYTPPTLYYYFKKN